MGVFINNKGINIAKNILNLKKIILFKIWKLKELINEWNLKSVCIINTLIKMFLLSQLDFISPLSINNVKVQNTIKIFKNKIYKIIFLLHFRFPSRYIDAIFLIKIFENKKKDKLIKFSIELKTKKIV